MEYKIIGVDESDEEVAEVEYGNYDDFWDEDPDDPWYDSDDVFVGEASWEISDAASAWERRRKVRAEKVIVEREEEAALECIAIMFHTAECEFHSMEALEFVKYFYIVVEL